jgi:cellulose synthase/poly-beta-1,6-N-acetylglucosamine synthase-like glycosyltransferase
MPEMIFWTAAVLILYTYLGYSLLICVLSVFFNNRVRKEPVEPTVTFLITAYNEEDAIRTKLEETLALDYPRDKLEIMVASDGSTDRTDSIVEEFADRGVTLVRVEGRVGKTETQNQAVQKAKGDIIIFSDATTRYQKDAIRKLVQNYADPSIGAVSGRYEYINPTGGQVGFANIIFWKYENLIKRCQTKIKTITGCCGCIYSVRRSLYTPLSSDIISDLVEPLMILQKGYRIAFEPDALAHEETTEKSHEEFRMRVRVITRGMNGLLSVRTLFNPFKYSFVSFQLVSHKVFRWMIPFFLIAVLVSNLFLLGNWFYTTTFVVQLCFYLLALLGFAAERFHKKNKLFSLPLYFCLVNTASVLAMLNLLKRQKATVWETARKQT